MVPPKNVPYFTMLASTDAGLYGIGLSEVETENSETLLQEALSAMEQLLAINDYLKQIGDKNRLTAYCGNRFNVPFVNGAASYYHY